MRIATVAAGAVGLVLDEGQNPARPTPTIAAGLRLTPMAYANRLLSPKG